MKKANKFIKFKKVVIIGPGLIGGSIGINLHKLKVANTIIGVARHKLTISQAKRAGSISEGSLNLRKAVVGADLVILATPVRAIENILVQIRDKVAKGCIIFDVGSTKKEIMQITDKIIPRDIYFVGTHPMAGSEKTGASYARGNIFKNSICFITKTKKTNNTALIKVSSLWKKMGAKTVMITSGVHDKIVAQISHLPHLMSVILVDSVREDFLRFASTGFKDTTRISAGAPGLWCDISLSNRAEILKAIGVFEKKMADLKKSIKNGKESALIKYLERAKKKRESIKK